jgi:very-short-patch-repair endonuclease
LNSIGLKVIRFDNEEVFHNPEQVREQILAAIKKQSNDGDLESDTEMNF